MKIIKHLAILSILTIIIGSCFNAPEFSVVPEIAFNDVKFVITPADSVPDVLLLTLNFKDGDGDLGLEQNGNEFISNPYNENNYYLEENGKIKAVPTVVTQLGDSAIILPVIDLENGETGKLVTVRTRNKPGYQYLPEYVKPYSETVYTLGDVYVKKGDERIFDETYGDTIKTFGSFYILRDTFYRSPNVNYYNIDVVFQVLTNNTEWLDFQRNETDSIWYVSPFNGRFPVLGTSNALEGTLEYTIANVNFIKWFGDKRLRLKIQIRDRALHESNIVYSREFSLLEQ